MLLCLHYSIVSYFVSVVYVMMYYYNASTAEIAFSVLQVLYEFVVVVVVVVANIHHMTFITLIIFIKFW